ncbi:hypothetical protein OG535_36730 [Kitasatospora sp. NBC_00085]|uniref:hypothetical protein n=1 Tax=unclassified Kitasatospora TaxID=2633591 RepID=UPI003244AFF5
MDERYALALGCRVSVEAGLSATRVNWSVGHISGEERTRPEQGAKVVPFTCHRCRRNFCVTVESRAKARSKRLVYQAVGWALLISLLVTVPMVVHLGGQTVDENDPGATGQLGILLLLAAVGFIGGLTFVQVGRAHAGVRKFRLVRASGKRTVWVEGHRLF